MVFVDQLILHIRVHTWVVVVAQHVLERVLRLLLLPMLLLVVRVHPAGQIVDCRVRIVTHTSIVDVGVVLPSRIPLRVLRLLLLVLVHILLVLIKV